MKFYELPLEWQEKLSEERPKLHKRNHIGKSSVILYNEEGTRFFYASYCSGMWRGDCPRWYVNYGAVQFARKYDDTGRGVEYEWRWGKKYTQSANGTDIPRWVRTKKDVLELVEKIGIFK